MPQRDYLSAGPLAVVDQGQALIGGYTESLASRHQSRGPVIVFGDHTKVFKFIDFPFAMGADGVKVLEVASGWDARFVFYYLQTVRLPEVGYSRHFKFLKEVRVPRPPIEEQRRTATILDQSSRMRLQAEESVAMLDSILPAFFATRVAVTPQMVRLGDVAEFIRGVTFKPSDKVDPGPQRIAVMRTKNVQRSLERSDEIYIDRLLITNDAKLLRLGDTLVSSANSWNLVGKACFVDRLESPAAIGGFVAALRSLGDIDPLVLFHWFTSPSVQATARSFSSQTTNIANLNMGRCLELQIPDPPAGLAREFRQLAVRVAQDRRAADSRLQQLTALHRSLQARAFSGRL